MAEDLPDPLVAIVAFLKADADVATLCAARVYGDELPRDQVDNEVAEVGQVKAIVVRASGMGASVGNRSRVGISSPRYDVFSYGETPYEAARVDRVVYKALKNMVPHDRGTCRLYDAILVGGPISLREEATDWPIRFRSYNVTAAETAVA